METVTLSLWLPISRSNFYTRRDSTWVEWNGDKIRSSILSDADYCAANPMLLVDVLRRVLEVLPESFGYAQWGAATTRKENVGDAVDEAKPRITSVTMTLNLSGEQALAGPTHRRANVMLIEAHISHVEAYINENGYYTFTATGSGTWHTMRAALRHHISEVFGGSYYVHPIDEVLSGRRENQGSASLKKYNGMENVDDDVPSGKPLGILSFYQLHVLAEGLWNNQLMPAVYLEQFHWLTKERPDLAAKLKQGIGETVLSVTYGVDARQTLGQIQILNRFLTVTVQTSLRDLGLAMESIRRRFLDEMMSSAHRHTRLAQLYLADYRRERGYQLAFEATEQQMKGYSSLMSAKIPLFLSLQETVLLAREDLEWQVAHSTSSDIDVLTREMERLNGPHNHWVALVKNLQENTQSLATTVQHSWMDQLLYEQQQMRSDQEAVAEIERSRQSQPGTPNAAPTQIAPNGLMLALAVLAIMVGGVGNLSRSDQGWVAWVTSLIPLAVVIAVFGLYDYVIRPRWAAMRRARRDRRGELASYPYEFAFRLGATVDRDKLRTFADDDEQRSNSDICIGRRPLVLRTRGFGRVEQMSLDSSLVKVHVAAAFRTGRRQFARFEIVHEINVHRTANERKYTLIQCRIFGESPTPLRTKDVESLLRHVLLDAVGFCKDPSEIDARKRVEAAFPQVAPDDIRASSTPAARSGLSRAA